MAMPILVEGYRGVNVARISNVLVDSETPIETDQSVFEIENHKVVHEVAAPASGILLHGLTVGDYIRLDMPIAFVAQPGEDHAQLLAQADEAKTDYDWDEVIEDRPQSGENSKPVPLRKAAEIATLTHGASFSAMSMVGTMLGHIRRSSNTMDFFSGKILDILVYEASRLLAGKKFSKLNASFEAGRIRQHGQVNAGVSFDEGGRLTVYAIENSDKLSLPEIQGRIVEGLMSYVGRKLTPREVATATFTISDMSAARLEYSLALLPRGQTLIIALTRSEADEYGLMVSFDHRVTEGMVVAAFLGELVKRLRSFGAEEMGLATVPDPDPSCSFCGRTLADEVGDLGGKGLMRIRDATNSDAWCCSTCWGGW